MIAPVGKRYQGRLTQREVLALLKTGRYWVDTEAGVVYGRGGRPLTIQKDEHREDRHVYCSVRLYDGRRRVGIGLARLVWMARLGRPVPRDFEIHHRDGDGQRNGWANLLCVHKEDHKKLHEGDAEGGVPF